MITAVNIGKEKSVFIEVLGLWVSLLGNTLKKNPSFLKSII